MNRKEYCEKYGLHNNATWADINNYLSNQNRKEYCERYGFHDNATWAEINLYLLKL